MKIYVENSLLLCKVNGRNYNLTIGPPFVPIIPYPKVSSDEYFITNQYVTDLSISIGFFHSNKEVHFDKNKIKLINSNGDTIFTSKIQTYDGLNPYTKSYLIKPIAEKVYILYFQIPFKKANSFNLELDGISLDGHQIKIPTLSFSKHWDLRMFFGL